MKLFKEINKKKNRFLKRYMTKPERKIFIEKKPISVLALRDELIANKVIPNDGLNSEDIININASAIWEKFKEVYQKNEKNNVRFGQFFFYLEENRILSQLFEVNPKYFEKVIGSHCKELGCSVEFRKEVLDELPGTILNKVVVRHNYLSRNTKPIL